jgi:rod shape-determining protein MreD
MNGRGAAHRTGAVLALVVLLHFLLRPFLGDSRVAPDLLLLALLVYAIGARPGAAAVAGFTVGLLADSLTPVAFGANAFAHASVGYLAAWGKAVFFAENLLVNAGFIFAGSWIRDLLVLVAGQHVEGSMVFWQLAVWSVLQAATTALAGVAVLAVFGRWLAVRMAQ